MPVDRPSPRTRLPRRAAHVLLPALLLLTAACGQKDKSKIPVAQVGDRVITLEYFERKMNGMGRQFLPPNIEAHDGRMELLETMINKEVLALKAEELGFAEDEGVEESAQALTRLLAVKLMKEEAVAGLDDVTEEEILDYYENLTRKLQVSYMLLNREEEAIEAKRLVEGGERWSEVAKKFSVGPPGPSQDYTMTITYGTLADDFERSVYDLGVGEISDPIPSMYGYFLIRVEGQSVERMPPLDEMRQKVIESIRKQKQDLRTLEFIHEVFDEYGFHINEETLDTLYAVLPPDKPLMPPPSQDELEPLALKPSHMDMELMRYADEVWTLRRYSDFYEQMSYLARPRRERLLGGLRRSLEEIAVRELMPQVAEDRGYMDRPEIQEQYRERREQVMVTNLHRTMMSDVPQVTPEEVDAYWAEHSEDFHKPERREVLALVASSQEQAEQAAQRAAEQDVDWSALLEEYGVEGTIRAKKGRVGVLTKETQTVWAEMAFDLDTTGAVAPPRQLQDGTWAIAKLVRITPEENPTLDDVRAQVGRAVEAQKKEELFRQRVEEWKADYPIKRYPENVDKAVLQRSDQEGLAGSAASTVSISGS